MSTVTGILRVAANSLAADRLRLRATGTRHVSSVGYAGGEIVVDLVNGGFSEELIAGVWEMVWPKSGEGKALITVPDDDLTYNFATLLGAGSPAGIDVEGSDFMIADTIAEMKALTTTEASLRNREFAVIVKNPDPGCAKIYYFEPESVVEADGFNVIADDGAYGRFFAVTG